MKRLFLLDAYALIYRAYYAFIRSPRVNSEGLNTSAIFGFCNTLQEIITKEQPDYIGVAFDKGKTFRHDMYPAYKAQREETPEDIKRSVPIIKDILNAYNIPSLTVENYEADDIIGTLAIKAANAGIEAYMLTPDKDYAQVVRPNVWMYRPRHGGGYETLGEKEVCEKFGIKNTSQVIDLLALMGDSADNFPGCPGVGEKTAQKLIAEYGSVENLIANSQNLKGKMREKVENAVDDILISKKLATIATDVPLNLDLDALSTKEPDIQELTALFSELEFKTFIKRLSPDKTTSSTQSLSLFDTMEDTVFDSPAGSTQKTSLKTLSDITHEYHLIESEEEMFNLAEKLSKAREISLDTETTGLNTMQAELVGLSFSIKEHEAYYVAISSDKEKAKKQVAIFKPIYEDKNVLKIGQNIKYDLEILHRYNVTLAQPYFDTMIAHYLLQPELKHNMDYMAETLLNYQTIHIDELIGTKGKNQLSMRQLQPAQIKDYACEDADITLQLKNFLEKKQDTTARRLFHDIEMPLVSVLSSMELSGIKLDTKALKKLSQKMTEKLKNIENEIHLLAGTAFNVSSPKQVGEVLFSQMRIVEKPKKTKTGQWVTSEEVLQQLASKHPIVEKILQYRGIKKLLSTYIDALPTLINPETEHIHTSFNQATTATGRLSSSEPNLQNIPVRGEEGREIRECFLPEERQLFFSADYSQIELRVMAHLSGDEAMQRAFKKGYDIHAATAAKIYNKGVEEVTRDERNKAKRANFGIIYGITVFGLAERLNIDRTEAKMLIDGYFETFPKVKEYMEKAKKEAKEKGFVETFLGRRRYLPDINSSNAIVRGFAERNAINAPIQGSAADVIKLAMINITQRFKTENIKSKMILQVHDELNFSVVPEEKETVEKIVIEEMEKAFPLNVPLVAECGWGKNWLETH